MSVSRSSNRSDHSPCSCACAAAQTVNTPRRRLIQIAAAGLAAPLGLSATEAWSKPADGDRLVLEEIEGVPAPLRMADIRPGKPLLAFPFDATRREVRDGTRLNKVVLMRFNENELDAETRARAAGGVLAFSAICTHQGCDLKTWSSKEQLLVCFCHSSKFNLREGGKVAAGPANRALPILPLKLEGDQLVVAGSFSAPPGGHA
jgi:Rieske Fe-S protein